MDGENNGKPYEQMDDLVGKPIIFGNARKGQPYQRIITPGSLTVRP